MTKRKRTLWDDLKEIGKEILNQLDDLLNPSRDRRKPQRVPVPIPVRNDDPRQPR